jgi:hypothetical protein
MAETRRDRERDTERESTTTVIHTDSGSSGGGLLLGVVLALLLFGLLFLLLYGGLDFGGVPEKVDVDVNVDVPELEMPEENPPAAPTENRSGP